MSSRFVAAKAVAAATAVIRRPRSPWGGDGPAGEGASWSNEERVQTQSLLNSPPKKGDNK